MDASSFTQAPDKDEMSEVEMLLNLYFSVPKSVNFCKTQQHKKVKVRYIIRHH